MAHEINPIDQDPSLHWMQYDKEQIINSADSDGSYEEIQLSNNTSPFDAPEDNPVKLAWHNRIHQKLIAGGTAIIALTTGAVLYTINSKDDSSFARHSNATSELKPTNDPKASEQMPVFTPNAVSSESLDRATPLIATVDETERYGSAKTIQTLFKDMQLADQTGNTTFIEAAIGTGSLSSELGANKVRDVKQFQDYFRYFQAQRLTFRFEAKNISQRMPDAPVWDVTAVQTNDGKTTGNQQTITLRQQINPDNSKQWVIDSIVVGDSI